MKVISVIIPIYYGQEYIADAVRQIEKCKECLGKEGDVEVIFVNDTPDVPFVTNWKSDLVNIRMIDPLHHTGIHGARVYGLQQCIGDFVLFLDQDDKIDPKYFRSQLLKLGENDAVVCKALNGGKEFYRDDTYFLNIPFKEFVLRNWNVIISPGQVLIKKKSIPNTWINNIMENNYADDWFLWICMYAEKCIFSLNRETLYDHTLHCSNTSDDVMGMLRSEHEMINMIYQKKILSDCDFGLLLEGFYKKDRARTQELYLAKKKLDHLDNWIRLRELNVKFSDYLFQSNIRRVAIYGCGTFGDYIYNELKTDIEIRYFIDKDASNIRREIPVYTLEDPLPETDAVIITLIGKTEEVEKRLNEKGFDNVIIVKEWMIDNRATQSALRIDSVKKKCDEEKCEQK